MTKTTCDHCQKNITKLLINFFISPPRVKVKFHAFSRVTEFHDYSRFSKFMDNTPRIKLPKLPIS